MKTCKNCSHLLRDEKFADEIRWKCNNYKDEEGKESSFDRLGDKEAAAGNGNCINWTEKQADEEQPEEESETEILPVVDEVEDMRLELESLRQFNEEVKRRNQEIEDAKEESSRAGKWLKKLREDIEEYINNFKPKKPLNATDHPLLFSGKKESEHSVNIDDWKNWPAKDHFDFTEKEWELMAPAEGVTEITVGYLSDFCVRLGREKIKGFGETKRQKLEVQFMNFWTAHPELCGVDSGHCTDEIDLEDNEEHDEESEATDDLFE